jgi:hypothetical protein
MRVIVFLKEGLCVGGLLSVPFKARINCEWPIKQSIRLRGGTMTAGILRREEKGKLTSALGPLILPVTFSLSFLTTLSSFSHPNANLNNSFGPVSFSAGGQGSGGATVLPSSM